MVICRVMRGLEIEASAAELRCCLFAPVPCSAVAHVTLLFDGKERGGFAWSSSRINMQYLRVLDSFVQVHSTNQIAFTENHRFTMQYLTPLYVRGHLIPSFTSFQVTVHVIGASHSRQF